MSELEFLLAEADVRALVRLLGEAATLDSTDGQRLHVMRGLCTLVEADAWVWGVSPFWNPASSRSMFSATPTALTTRA